MNSMKNKTLHIAFALAIGLFNFIHVQAQSGDKVYVFGWACSITWDSNKSVSHKVIYISNINEFDKESSIAWQSVNTNPLWKNHFKNIIKPYPDNEFTDYVETRYDYQAIIDKRSEIISFHQQKGYEIHQVNDFIIPQKDLNIANGKVTYSTGQSDGQSGSPQQKPNNNQSEGATALAALQAQQERDRQALTARQAENERQRTQQAERQRQLEQKQWQQQEQVMQQQQDAQNKAQHDAAVTAYYSQKRAENLEQGAEELANVIAEGISYFAAQKQASAENAERYRQQALAEEQAEKERLAAEEEENERIRTEQAMMRAEAERLENERIAAERTFRMNSRNNIFSAFKEADIPLSNSKIEANKLYYFMYAYDNTNLAGDNFVVYLSAPFEIDRFGDGTWPYKKNVMNEIAQLTPYQEVLHGYYTTMEEARQMYNSFSQLLSNTQTVIKPVNYKGKISTAASNTGKNTNFWGETAAKEEPDAATKPKSVPVENKAQEYDFWGNPIKK